MHYHFILVNLEKLNLKLYINDLVLFMGTLTGDTIERIGIPKSVPSGLSIN